jgi:Rps23 Pro-64 3,4-dihydroxylase Tpa1-like proline 4-hydroxylase
MLHQRAESPAGEAPAPRLRINPDLDLEALAQTYAAEKRVRIYGLLSEGAVELHEQLETRQDWIHLISCADGVIELDRKARAELSARRWAEIEAAAHARARTGFQYRYFGLRVPDEKERGGRHDLLSEFSRLMTSKPMLDLLRAVTGHDGVAFTDGHATAYGPGDFLTGHDDAVAGKNRLAAYVYGLTPNWRLEWGGMLLFHGHMDRTATGLVPRFNTLDLFTVPQQHSVSQVTPSAPHRRFAVTGWLRGSGA